MLSNSMKVTGAGFELSNHIQAVASNNKQINTVKSAKYYIYCNNHKLKKTIASNSLFVEYTWIDKDEG